MPVALLHGGCWAALQGLSPHTRVQTLEVQHPELLPSPGLPRRPLPRHAAPSFLCCLWCKALCTCVSAPVRAPQPWCSTCKDQESSMCAFCSLGEGDISGHALWGGSVRNNGK